MKNKVWKDKSEKLELNAGFVRIGYIHYINILCLRIPQLDSMRVYPTDCDSEAKWNLFCKENRILKWCYLEELINL